MIYLQIFTGLIILITIVVCFLDLRKDRKDFDGLFDDNGE